MSPTRERAAHARRGRLRRLRAVLAAGLVLGLGVSMTTAGWADEEHVKAEFSALTLPAPELTQPCGILRGVLGIPQGVAIYWELPADYSLDDVELYASTGGLGSLLAPLTGFDVSRTNTFRQADGTYRTEVPTGLLGGVLSLGGALELSIVIEKHGWVSEGASVESNAGVILGLGTYCTNLT